MKGSSSEHDYHADEAMGDRARHSNSLANRLTTRSGSFLSETILMRI